MHIGFMVCETCHINRDIFTALRYDWTDSETAEFVGKPFGARFNPNVGSTSLPAHFISRITVFNETDGKSQSMFNDWDADKAKAYLAQENQLTLAERDKQLAYFHKDIHKTGNQRHL